MHNAVVNQFSGLLQMTQNMYGQLEKLISSVHHMLLLQWHKLLEPPNQCTMTTRPFEVAFTYFYCLAPTRKMEKYQKHLVCMAYCISVYTKIKRTSDLDQKVTENWYLTTVNKQGCFGHELLSSLIWFRLFTWTGHYRRVPNSNLRALWSFSKKNLIKVWT